MGIRVASLNVWALPANLARHEAARMKAIAAGVAPLELDLVAFQEAWSPESRDTLVAGARAAGLRWIWHPANSSGLVIASRHPLRDIHFETYEARGFPERFWHLDYWSGKGFVLATVDAPDGPIVFANTHLHANYARPGEVDEYEGIRAAQLLQFATRLREVGDEPVIAVGDFNITESEDGYRVLRGLSGLRDVAVSLDRRLATVRHGNPYRKPTSLDARIDYVWQRPGAHRRAVAKKLERVFDAPLEIDGDPGNYSDHAGLLAEFEIEAQRELRTRPAPSQALVERARALIGEGRAVSRRRRFEQRVRAGLAGIGTVAGTAAYGWKRHSRRRFLHAGLVFSACVSGAYAIAQLWLSEWMHPRETAGFDPAEAQLDLWQAEAQAQEEPPMRDRQS